MKFSLPKISINDPILVSFSYDDSEDENTPLLSHLPLVGSIEHEPPPALTLPKWVHTTREVVVDLSNDPTY
jgi:hypothetical protein